MFRNRTRSSAPGDPGPTNRRAVLLGISAATAGLAGCSTFMQLFDDLPLEDVTVVNALDGRGSGSIELIDPDGERVLDDRFDPEGGAVLPPNGDVGADQVARFEDVLSAAGTYAISVELDEESEVDGAPALEADLEVDAPDDQHVMVALDGEETAEPIAVAVVESLDDITDWESCAAGC